MDAISSWWTNLHGHAHPYIAQRIYEQASQLEHVIFAGCTHEPAVQLAERLLPLLPGDMQKVFYSDNGSTAVEVALKMAIQFQQQANISAKTKRTKILAFNNAYHGDTFGTMSVSERGVFTLAFQQFLFEVIFIDPLVPLKQQQIPLDEIACFIYEPLVQGASGMIMHTPEQLDALLMELKKQQILCIADEVMTGFGRTGKLFASEYLEQKPDIICLSKGLTGGALPLSITACTQTVFNAFLSDNLHHTLFHGHSYTANPVACAAGLASLDLLLKTECMSTIESITRMNEQFVDVLKKESNILHARSRGTILAFEINSEKNEYLSSIKQQVITQALSQGVLLRPLGNTIYIMPPYCITEKQLHEVHQLLLSIAGSFNQ